MPIRSPISTERSRRGLTIARALAFGLALAGAADAAPPAPRTPEQALAATYFEQGRALMSEGKYAEACPKLEESLRLDPGGGTLLNVALCHEKAGRLATAWIEFRQARTAARSDNRPDREAAADAEIKKIEPLLSKISIVVPADSDVPKLRVTLDGIEVARAGWSTPFPVDPGAHALTAEAPGFEPYRDTIDVGAAAGAKTVTIPRLKEAKPGATGPAGSASGQPPPVAGGSGEAPALPTARSGMSPRRIAGFVSLGVGVVGVGVGAAFGAAALSKHSASNELCPGDVCSPAQAGAIPLNEDARSFARISDVAIGVGALGVVAGVVLVLTAPSSSASGGPTVGLTFDPSGARASVRGTF